LAGIAPDSRVAYVITGLDDAACDDVLARAGTGAGGAIARATDRTPAIAGGVYLAPAAASTIVADDLLRLVDHVGAARSGRIDRLFRSLAVEHGARAIGVVLASDGVDGVLGLAAIKDRGGIAIALDPNHANQANQISGDVLPRAAIAAGVIDLIGAAGELAG